MKARPHARAWWLLVLGTLLAGCSPTYTSFDVHGNGSGPSIHEALGDEVLVHLEDGSSARGGLSHVGEDSIALSAASLTGGGSGAGTAGRLSFPRASVLRVERVEDPRWAGVLAGTVGVGMLLFMAVIVAFSTLSVVPGAG